MTAEIHEPDLGGHKMSTVQEKIQVLYAKLLPISDEDARKSILAEIAALKATPESRLDAKAQRTVYIRLRTTRPKRNYKNKARPKRRQAKI